MTMKVLVADDSRIMSERLKDILWEITWVEVIGRAKDPPEVIEMLRILNTELAIAEVPKLSRERIGCKEVYGIKSKSNLE